MTYFSNLKLLVITSISDKLSISINDNFQFKKNEKKNIHNDDRLLLIVVISDDKLSLIVVISDNH